MRKRVLLAMFLGALFAAPANAAFINVNDNDLANITLTAGDFEGGFFVDGVLLTSGLGNSASITFADGAVHTVSGTWITNGLVGPAVNILFALPASPTNVTSFLRLSMPSANNLVGDFGGFTGATYFVTALATLAQNGQVVNAGLPFLSISFDSEAPAQTVPEPATLLLFGLGTLTLAPRLRNMGNKLVRKRG